MAARSTRNVLSPAPPKPRLRWGTEAFWPRDLSAARGAGRVGTPCGSLEDESRAPTAPPTCRQAPRQTWVWMAWRLRRWCSLDSSHGMDTLGALATVDKKLS